MPMVEVPVALMIAGPFVGLAIGACLFAGAFALALWFAK